jgi:hypothetical protein
VRLDGPVQWIDAAPPRSCVGLFEWVFIVAVIVALMVGGEMFPW